jgi:hypothetical protein
MIKLTGYWNTIKYSIIERRAASAITKEMIGELLPSLELHQIKEMLAETTKRFPLLCVRGSSPGRFLRYQKQRLPGGQGGHADHEAAA